MNPKQASFLIIVVSILFAAAMISLSLLLNNTLYHDYTETAVFFLIALWFIPFSYLSRFINKKCEVKAK